MLVVGCDFSVVPKIRTCVEEVAGHGALHLIHAKDTFVACDEDGGDQMCGICDNIHATVWRAYLEHLYII